MIEKATETFSEYWALMKDLLPLILVTASLTFVIGLHYIRKSYLQHTWRQVIGNLVFSSVMAAMLAICMVCLAELILPTVSVKIEMGIAIFVGLFGMKGIDTFLRRKFNLGVVDFTNPDEVPKWAKDLIDNEGGKAAEVVNVKTEGVGPAAGSADKAQAISEGKENGKQDD